MKPAKSIYWMTTIILSYAILGGIASAIITLPFSNILPSFVNTVVFIACDVVAIWFAAKHISKKSVVSSSSTLKTVTSVVIVCILLDVVLATVGKGGMAIMVSGSITTVVLGGLSYFFLNKVQSQ